MKNLILFIVVASFISCKTNSKIALNKTQNKTTENFEGIIKYKFLMDNIKGLSDQEIESKLKLVEALFGRHMVYYIKEPKMKSVIDGDMIKLNTYNDDSDSMYTYSPEFDELRKGSTYDNWNFKYDTIIIKKNAITIKDKSCDLIRFKSEKYSWDYYYNDHLKVNPENYMHYQSCFWNKAIELSNSLPMRFEGKVPGAYIYMEVEEIISQPLQDSLFEIPIK